MTATSILYALEHFDGTEESLRRVRACLNEHLTKDHGLNGFVREKSGPVIVGDLVLPVQALKLLMRDAYAAGHAAARVTPALENLIKDTAERAACDHNSPRKAVGMQSHRQALADRISAARVELKAAEKAMADAYAEAGISTPATPLLRARLMLDHSQNARDLGHGWPDMLGLRGEDLAILDLAEHVAASAYRILLDEARKYPGEPRTCPAHGDFEPCQECKRIRDRREP